jgi:hypothetical protein
MNPQASWPNVIQRAATHFLLIGGHAPIFEQYLESFPRPAIGGILDAPARQLDGPPALAVIRMANHVRQRFIHSACNRTAFLGGKAQLFGQLRNRAPDHTQDLRITIQLKS